MPAQDFSQQAAFSPMGAQQPMQDEYPAASGSPSMNYIEQENHIDEREKAFEQAFKDLAYNVVSNKLPHLVPNIVTLKILKSSIEDGDAVGAFIMNLEGESFYIPVVMSDNKLRPLDILYSKKADKFLPLNKDWIEIVTQSSDKAMGESQKYPENLDGDKDVSRLVYPPIQGRYSYAADFSTIDHLEIIKEASNSTKDQYKTMLTSNKKFLKFAFENFGEDRIKDALAHTTEKVASVPIELEVVDLYDPSMKVKEVFGNDSAQAMKDMARNGFAYKDERLNLNAVSPASETKLTLQEPTESGVYTIYDAAGSSEPALVLVNPADIKNQGYLPFDSDSRKATVGESVYGDWSYKERTPRKEYMVIKENGDYFYTSKIVGSPASFQDYKGPVASALFSAKPASNVAKTNVCFIKMEGNITAATKGMYVDLVEIGQGGEKKYIKLDPYLNDRKQGTAIYDEKQKSGKSAYQHCVVHVNTPTGKLLSHTNSNIVYVPKTYTVIKLGDKLSDQTHMTSETEILGMVQQRLSGTGGRTVKIANFGAGEYAVNGVVFGNLKEASERLAKDYRIHMGTAVTSFKKLAHFGDKESLLIYPRTQKTASIFVNGVSGTQMGPGDVQDMYTQQHSSPEEVSLAEQYYRQQAMMQQQQQGFGMPPQGMPPEMMGHNPEMDPSMMGMPQEAMNQQAQGGGMPQQGMPPPDQSMMQTGMQTQDPELYSVGALSALSSNPDIKELLAVYSPTLEKALDNLGRMLLTFLIRGKKAKTDLGEETYYATEDSLRTVFKNLGSLVLRLNSRAATMSME